MMGILFSWPYGGILEVWLANPLCSAPILMHDWLYRWFLSSVATSAFWTGSLCSLPYSALMTACFRSCSHPKHWRSANEWHHLPRRHMVWCRWNTLQVLAVLVMATLFSLCWSFFLCATLFLHLPFSLSTNLRSNSAYSCCNKCVAFHLSIAVCTLLLEVICVTACWKRTSCCSKPSCILCCTAEPMTSCILSAQESTPRPKVSLGLQVVCHVLPAGYYIRQLVSLSVAVLIGYLSIPVVQNLMSSRQAMNTSFDPLRIVNTYGAFGS